MQLLCVKREVCCNFLCDAACQGSEGEPDPEAAPPANRAVSRDLSGNSTRPAMGLCASSSNTVSEASAP